MTRFPNLLRHVMTAAALAAALLGGAHAAVPEGWTTVDVLDGRLSLALPAGAQPTPIGPTRLAQPGERRMNQAFALKIGAHAVQVVVAEMLALSDQPIEEVGRVYAERLVPARAATPPSISVVPSRPNGIDVVTFALDPAPKERVKSAILRRRDNLLMRVDFHADDPAAAKSPDVAAAIDTIVQSVALGARELPTGKGVTLVHGELTLDLPPGYAAMEEAREDATLVNVMPILRTGQRRGTLSIYVGHDVRSCHGDRSGGTLRLFGRTGEWNVAPATDGMLQRNVCLLDPSDPYDAPQVKIHVIAPDARTERELIGILKTFRSKTLR